MFFSLLNVLLMFLKKSEAISHFSEISAVQWLHLCVKEATQSTFTFSKLTIETLEQGVKYVQS